MTFLHKLALAPKIRAAVDRNELWRARDILRGRIGGREFSAELYEQLGAVLLAMGDLPEAGKYLFLSGERRSEYVDAIEVYLTRYGTNVHNLVDTFPGQVRRAPLQSVPPLVRDELVKRGYRIRAGSDEPLLASQRSRTTPMAAWMGAAGCFVIAVFLFASIVAGVPVLLRIVTSAFR